MSVRHYLPACCLAASLLACGGSTSSTSSDSGLQTLVPENVTPGSSVGFGVLATSGAIQSVRWTQVGGPTVALEDTRNKLVGCDIPQAGDYAFQAAVQDTDGTQRSAVIRFTASGSAPQANIRLDRTVVTRSQVSLRAWHSFGTSAQVTYQWQQTSGPTATLNATNQALLLFQAPQVSTDTLLTFKVTITAAGGASATDEAWVLDEAATIDESAIFYQYANNTVTGNVHTYRPNAPHAADLAACTYSNTLSQPCALSRLPFIAQETRSPSVDDIMSRVLVSHDWMGQRFEDYLNQADTRGDLRRLLRPVTAVVLSADVRPSFYWAATGAIYLDPSDLWLTPEERDTIIETPDYRSNFDRDLQFSMPWRLVKNNDYTSYYYPPDWRGSRTLSDTLIDLAALLYHELGHANDYIPPADWDSLTNLQTPLSAASAFQQTSAALTATYPLQSQEMRDLAGVAFGGTAATATQKAYRPADIVPFFVPDRAVDFYSYSDQAEDLAELFSFLLLRVRYGVDADVAITNHPQGDNVTAHDYIVTWGQRGRIGEAAIKPRVAFGAPRLLPELDVAAALASLPAPKLMRPGEDWVANLELGVLGTAAARPDVEKLRRAAARPVQLLPRDSQRALPDPGRR